MDTAKVKILASLLKEVNILDLSIKEKKEKHKEELNPLATKKESLDNQINDLKEDLEQQALQEFKESGSKNLYGGIKIQERKTLDYDADKALEFAKEKGLFLSLDKKAFEKSAPTLGEDWIKTGKEDKVTYPKVFKLD